MSTQVRTGISRLEGDGINQLSNTHFCFSVKGREYHYLYTFISSAPRKLGQEIVQYYE